MQSNNCKPKFQGVGTNAFCLLLPMMASLHSHFIGGSLNSTGEPQKVATPPETSFQTCSSDG
jgi:hypothetical protein